MPVFKSHACDFMTRPRVFVISSLFFELTNSKGINLQVLNIHDDSEKLEAIPRILVSKLRWISRRLRFCYFDGAPLGLEPLPLQVCVT